LDMRGELDDTAAFKNFKKWVFSLSRILILFKGWITFMNDHEYSFFRWGNIEFPLPFGRVMSPTESFVHGLDEKVNKYTFTCTYIPIRLIDNFIPKLLILNNLILICFFLVLHFFFLVELSCTTLNIGL
jgi:hypothetical protein